MSGGESAAHSDFARQAAVDVPADEVLLSLLSSVICAFWRLTELAFVCDTQSAVHARIAVSIQPVSIQPTCLQCLLL